MTNSDPLGCPPAESSDLKRYDRQRTPTIADRYADLLSTLSERQRRSIVLRLTVGFYEGWNPSRGEIADLVAEQLGWLTPEEALQRQRQRKAGNGYPISLPAFWAPDGNRRSGDMRTTGLRWLPASDDLLSVVIGNRGLAAARHRFARPCLPTGSAGSMAGVDSRCHP